MTGTKHAEPSPLDELRQSFDQSFAVPQVRESWDLERFVAIRIGRDRFALRTHEIAGIEPKKPILPLPVDRRALLGVAGLRGRLVPIYSLALLLGYSETVGDRQWLALIGQDSAFGIAFSEFEGQVQASPDDLSVLGHTEDHPFARQVLRHAGGLLLVLDISRITAACQPSKE